MPTLKENYKSRKTKAFLRRQKDAEIAAADPRWQEEHKLKIYSLEELERFAKERGTTVSPNATGKITIPTLPDKTFGQTHKED